MPYQDERLPEYPTETSEATAEAIDPKQAQALRERIFDFILNCGSFGATDEEIQERLLIPGNTERPRRWELSSKQDRIKPTGKTRETRTGRQAIVWTINPTPGLKKPKETPPKQVTVTQKRNGQKIRQFKSFVTGKGNVQVITFPQTLAILSGDEVTIS